MKKVMFLFAASVMIAACGGKGEVALLAFVPVQRAIWQALNWQRNCAR